MTESGLTPEEMQKERLEYVQNIEIEYRFGCEAEKRPDSCHLLGEYMEAVKQDFSTAFQLFRDNCEQRDYPKSCHKYGTYLLSAQGGCEPSLVKSIRPFEIACDAKMPKSCRLLALVHWNRAPDKDPDPQMAEEYMKRACDLDDGEACWLLNTWYMGPSAKFTKRTPSQKEKAQTGHLERDMQKSIDYGIRACDSGIFQACGNVSRIFKLGDGVTKDLDKAKEYMDKANEITDNLKKGIDAGFTG